MAFYHARRIYLDVIDFPPQEAKGISECDRPGSTCRTQK
jgi:hypothetical protein